MKHGWLAIVIVLGVAGGTARADATKVFPLAAGELPEALRRTPSELTRVLVRSYEADASFAPIEDAAQLLQCELAASECLASIARSVDATRIVFGRVERHRKGVTLTLVTFDGRRQAEKRFVLEGETADELAAALADELDGGRRVREPRAPERPSADNPEPDPPSPEPVDPEPAAPASGTITRGTWGLVIGGALATAAGAGFLIAANSLRDDVARAPTETRADIDRLVALERAGTLRAQIGGALMIGGGAVLVAGIVRAVIQKRAPETERFEVVPESGGASVRFTWRWP